MTMEQADEIYVVVMNDEEQYSIWLEYKAIPDGWRQVGEPGTKEECLDYIKDRLDRYAPAQPPPKDGGRRPAGCRYGFGMSEA